MKRERVRERVRERERERKQGREKEGEEERDQKVGASSLMANLIRSCFFGFFAKWQKNLGAMISVFLWQVF